MSASSSRFWPPPPKSSSGPPPRACDHPGCRGEGAYRAPKSRDTLTDYYWFCLDHVRAYNQNWDFFAGCSMADIEQAMREDTTWQRQTWPMGDRIGGKGRFKHFHGFQHKDGFGLFDEDGPGTAQDSAKGGGSAPRRDQGLDAQTIAALKLMDLAPPVTPDDIRQRYKDLCKRYHPDANGGSAEAEEQFKRLGLAYHILQQRLGA